MRVRLACAGRIAVGISTAKRTRCVMAIGGRSAAALSEVVVPQFLIDGDGVIEEPRPAGREFIEPGCRQHVGRVMVRGIVISITKGVRRQIHAVIMLAGIARRAEGMTPAERDIVLIRDVLRNGKPSAVTLPLVLELEVIRHVAVHELEDCAHRGFGRELQLHAKSPGVLIRDVLIIQAKRVRVRRTRTRTDARKASRRNNAVHNPRTKYPEYIALPVDVFVHLIGACHKNADLVGNVF